MTFNGAWRSHITGVVGWESHAEQELLYSLAQIVPDGGCIVEIGAEFGMSASLFCKGAKPTVDIYSIDLFPDDVLHKHRKNLMQAGFGEGMFTRSIQIKSDSQIAGRMWAKDSMPLVDLLFVDGDHSYKGVKADIEVWTPLVKPEGYIAFHDCAAPTNANPHYLHYEVQQAVDEWQAVAQWIELQSVDSIRVFRRPA